MNDSYDELQLEIIHKAKQKAMSILLYMDRTEFQLRSKLEEGEFPPFAIEEAVEYVRSFHYIDDERYAANFVLSKKGTKSKFELKQELKKRGVDEYTIENAIAGGEVCEYDAIKTLFLKKYGKKDLSDPKIFEKAVRYFASKGYSYSDIKKAIYDAIAESEE